MFAALEDLDCNVDINMAWDNIRDNIKILAKGLIKRYSSRNNSLATNFKNY
jgi:hypothetical protein